MRSQGLMDYSLLIAIENINLLNPPTPQKTAINTFDETNLLVMSSSSFEETKNLAFKNRWDFRESVQVKVTEGTFTG